MARHALFAAPARKYPPACHAGAHCEVARRVRGERNEFAAEIATENMRELSLVRLVASRARHQVIAVEAHGVDFDQRLTAFKLWHAEVGVFENVGVAILLENDRLHLRWEHFTSTDCHSRPSKAFSLICRAPNLNGAMSMTATTAAASATRSRAGAKSSVRSYDILRLAFA